MVGKIGCNPLQSELTRKFSEIGFTKLFLCMRKIKKNAAGPAAVYQLSDEVKH